MFFKIPTHSHYIYFRFAEGSVDRIYDKNKTSPHLLLQYRCSPNILFEIFLTQVWEPTLT